MIKDKLGLIQLNIKLVKNEDIEFLLNFKVPIVFKVAIYKGLEKNFDNKIIDIMKKYDSIYLGFDWIIPQNKKYARYCYLRDINEGIRKVKEIIKNLKKENLENRILTTS